MTFKEALELLERAIRKKVVRGNKIIRKKFSTKPGYKMSSDGKEVKMSASEKRKRKLGAKKAARKKKGKQSIITRKRNKSMKKSNRI